MKNYTLPAFLLYGVCKKMSFTYVIDMVGVIILKDDMSGRLLWQVIVELGGVEVNYNMKYAYRQVATR